MASTLLRSIAALGLAAGLAVAAPTTTRADSFSFSFSDGDSHHRGGDRHYRGRDRDDRRYSYRWRPGPRWYSGYYAYPPVYAQPYPRHCWLEWSHRYHGYVRVCR